MRILIADDHPIFVEALIGLLERDGIVASWQRAASFGEMLVQLQGDVDCALVLMDLDNNDKFETALILTHRGAATDFSYADII